MRQTLYRIHTGTIGQMRGDADLTWVSIRGNENVGRNMIPCGE